MPVPPLLVTCSLPLTSEVGPPFFLGPMSKGNLPGSKMLPCDEVDILSCTYNLEFTYLMKT